MELQTIPNQEQIDLHRSDFLPKPLHRQIIAKRIVTSNNVSMSYKGRRRIRAKICPFPKLNIF